MSPRQPFAAGALALTALVFATGAEPLAPNAFADSALKPSACPYTTLTSGVVATVSTTPQDFSYTATTIYWSAVGIRSAVGDDWDLGLYDTQGAEPTCVSGPLAVSTAVLGVDFVVGDYNNSPLTQEWIRATRASGSQPATLEYDDGAHEALVNGPRIVRTTGPADVLEVWDIYLEAGSSYTFNLLPSGGSNCTMLLFCNPASAGYWVGRSAAVLQTNGTATYTAPVSDFYGLVVVNDDGSSGQYEFFVRSCRTPEPLTSGTVTLSQPPFTSYSFLQSHAYWSAVGVRQPAADWDIAAYDTLGAGPYPGCFSTQLGVSYEVGVVDFVLGDFNVNPQGDHYVDVMPYFGDANWGEVEWDSGANALVVNGQVTSRSTGPNDVLEVWDVYLEAGVQYTCGFSVTGATNVRLLVFENPGSSPYWTTRSGASLVTASTTNYTPAQTGFHGVVVVNDDGASGSYSLRIGTCSSPTMLSSGVPVTVPGSLAYHAFEEPYAFWAAVGVRGSAGGNWNVGVWGDSTGGTWPSCFSSLLSGSSETGVVDVVVGDFNHGGWGTYYVRPYLVSGSPGALLEWDGGTDVVQVNGPLIERSTDAGDVLEVWDVYLEGGVSYDIYFEHTRLVDASLLLYQSAGGTYWAPRTAAALSTTGPTASFTAPVTDWYGIVVVNDNGVAGNYRFGIATNLSGSSPGVTPRVSALGPIGPNPSTGEVRIGFDLHAPSTVTLEVMTAAGRLVRRLPSQALPAGTWSTTWDGSDASGRQVAAGVYYLRMLGGTSEIGRQKLLRLH